MSEEREAQGHRNHVKLERLELALRASNEGIWDWQTDETRIFYSRRILEFLECGKDHAPNLFLPPFAPIHEEDRQSFLNGVDRALQDSGPETLAVDARVQTGSGTWRWLKIRGTVLRDRLGKATRIAGSMIDISQRKAAEAQVEDERYLLRQLIDHVPLQIYFKDPASHFVMANQGMAEWLNLHGESDLLGKRDQDFFDSDHWQAARRDEEQILQNAVPIIGKLEHETGHHHGEAWVLTSKFPWRDRKGNIKGTFGISNDVTRLVKAQQEATDLALELNKKNEAYEEELHLAREIQQALAGQAFPCSNSDGTDRIRFGARYIPISGLAGDFFEVMQVNQNSMAVLICDVMGHGVRSALIVAMLRGLLEKQRAQAHDPGLFLHGLNDGLTAILERAKTTMFATAFFGVLDLADGTFKYACAGHPGPIIAGKDGIRQLAACRNEKGPALGLIRGAVFPTNQIMIDQMDRMVMFTDGVLEAENIKGEPFFENRLMEIITRCQAAPLDELLDGILASVLAFSESEHFDDDVCLLALELPRPA
jgi:sigma-B regulation protein RsbU (phosphoserine phosphatase)